MRIQLINAGKRYQQEWIFKNMHLHLDAGTCIAITGHNGSGKSSFLRVLSGFLSLTEGQIVYSTTSSEPIARENVYRHISMAAPWLDIIEDFTLTEFLLFHSIFRTWRCGLQIADIQHILELPTTALDKPLTLFSSGMKQRVRLATAILTDSSLLLLDEPGSNLDTAGNVWWKNLLEQHADNRTIIIAGNDSRDLELCQLSIHIPDYKPAPKKAIK